MDDSSRDSMSTKHERPVGRLQGRVGGMLEQSAELQNGLTHVQLFLLLLASVFYFACS